MFVEVLVAITLLAAVNGPLKAEQAKPSPQVGDEVVLCMTGDLAADYARCAGYFRDGKTPAGWEIQSIATIAYKLQDGRVRVESSHHFASKGDKTRLITLSASVDPSSFTTVITPAGTKCYSSPADLNNPEGAKVSIEATKTFQLELAEAKGLKLRSWTLVEEIGE